MNARSKGWIATIAAVVLCGCPGLLLCIMGAAFAAGAPLTTEVNGVSGNTQVPLWAALGMLFAALILILVPVVVAFLTLRSKPAPIAPSVPIPPAS